MNASPAPSVEQHNIEISENQRYWDRKPLLRLIYRGFHQLIARYVRRDISGPVVELGSGIGNIKEVIPECLRTDLFPNPWLDQLENAYALSFKSGSATNLILMDVFHHLRYPGTALDEMYRVLQPGGRLIIFDPCISALGAVVYGLMHHEPVAYSAPITWQAPAQWNAKTDDSYYAAQGNATRVFAGIVTTPDRSLLSNWKIVLIKKLSALSYIGSGGYRGPQLYPDSFLPAMRSIDRVADLFPSLFATRLLVVLEKKI